MTVCSACFNYDCCFCLSTGQTFFFLSLLVMNTERYWPGGQSCASCSAADIYPEDI